MLFSTASAPFHTPTSSAYGSTCSTSSPALVIFCFFGRGHPNAWSRFARPRRSLRDWGSLKATGEPAVWHRLDLLPREEQDKGCCPTPGEIVATSQRPRFPNERVGCAPALPCDLCPSVRPGARFLQNGGLRCCNPHFPCGARQELTGPFQSCLPL